MREQDRTLERKRSINGFHKQVNLVERTWNDDLRAMSYGVGSAVVLLVTDQNLILQTAFHGWNVANARPASGQAAPTPPSSVMNSRLFIRSPRRRGRAVLAARRDRDFWYHGWRYSADEGVASALLP